MIINYLYLISIGVAILTIIFIIYNYTLLVKRKKADHRDEDKKQNILKVIKNNIITFVVILAICIGFIIYFSRPIDIYKAIEIGENINYETISKYGSNSTSKLESEKGKAIFALLEKYKYKRTFNFADVTGGEGLFISLESTDGELGFIEIWEKGYIRRPNYKVYKIQSEDKAELYIQLSNLLEK
ncbi:hypothetical protein R0131_03320 [Clostridium sp. AL.422]|uniref:hypothetical protein n=1 Tax=Clostridium TaxID=1485 RepID=UPI00293DB97F|nr:MULTISPECIES: hypothetical protein [unclassified Clostridium]MDV4149856.1 hypothetical protein [Clostridium sp. AL.422]